MKYRYTKFTGDLLDDLDLEDLVAKLSDLLLSSGFGNPYAIDDDDERTMQALHDAILDALFNGGVLPEETIERLLGDPADGDQADARSKLEELIQQIIERMGEQGYITTPPDLEAERAAAQRAAAHGREQPPVHVRSHRQDARLPRLPRAARSARVARQEQLRPPRHARAGDRRRDDRRAEAVRVRRHAEPRSGEHAAERRPARSARDALDAAAPAASPGRRPAAGSTSRTKT